MSCTCRVAAAGTCSRLPFERSSTTCTSSPRARSASTTCEPMNPAPPVTRARIAVIYPEMFITFEGLDGSGKTTQARLLGARLEAEGIEVVLTREPGGTPLGEEIRDLVLHGGEVAPWAEAALYAASRAQHVEQLIRPALERGATVISDRYVDSSVAYQGIARGLGLERVLELNLAAVEGLMPDRTILLEIRADDAVGRMGGERDRIEREEDDFHARAARAYRQLAEREPDRFVVVDGTASTELLAEEIYGRVGIRYDERLRACTSSRGQAAVDRRARRR